MQYTIIPKSNEIDGQINLPASKSISNRILIINALSYSSYEIGNLSNSDDTEVLNKALSFTDSNVFDIGHAGTAMRFLTAFLSRNAGVWEITGSERMRQRPIKILVDALVKLGAKIEYVEKEGFPPLRIYGCHLKGGSIRLDGSISSQYISALLMIAPVIENGLTLELENKITSSAYISMTLSIMSQFGIKYKWEGNIITIPEQAYIPTPFKVESDWSGASYWYEIAALSGNVDLLLDGLLLDSIQGDNVQASWFKTFGVESTQERNGVRLKKIKVELPKLYEANFVENPDIAQTFAVMCVCLNVPFKFSGLETLKIKETNRINALITELDKMGASLYEPSNGQLAWNGIRDENKFKNPQPIDTYNDHRMALAFAPAAIINGRIRINNPEVVSKSYPSYWDDLESIGFAVC